MALYKRRLPDGSRSPTWYYDFRIRGKRYKGCTSQRDKKKAREFEDELKADVRLGRPLGGPKKKVLPRFNEFAQEFLRGEGALKQTADDDASILQRALLPFLGNKPLDDIQRSDVEQFRNKRLAGKLSVRGRNRKGKPAPETVRKELGLLKHILNIAVDSGLLQRNPAARVKMPKCGSRRDRVIDPEEYARLLLAVDSRVGPHMRTLIILGYETGMREGEILALQWADVDFRRHHVRLRRTKTGEPRTVPLSEKAEQALRDWGRGDSTFVFPSLTGEGHLGHVSHAFSRLAERARVEGVRFHDLRHTFCTRMVEQEGVDLITLAAITGHKSLNMLKRYSHPSDARKLALVRREVPPISHHARSGR